MNRVDKVLSLAHVQPGEGVLIHKPSNMFYLSGYTGEGLIAAGPGFQAIVTDFRYTEQAERQAPGFDVLMVEKGVSHAALAYRLFQEKGVSRVRYEDDQVTVRSFEALKKAMPGMEFASLDNAPETARRIKDADELQCIEDACNISCKAFDLLLPRIKPGLTEKQLQIMLDYTMLEQGADGLAFNTIVASGENGSLPHAIPGDRVVQLGDEVRFGGEAFAKRGRVRKVRRENLDGDRAVEGALACNVNDAHAAAAEFGERLKIRAVERGRGVRLARDGRMTCKRIQLGGEAFQVIGKFSWHASR